MRNIYMHYGLLIVTLMLAVVVSACGESSSPSKQEAAPSADKTSQKLDPSDVVIPTFSEFLVSERQEMQKKADSGDTNAMYELGRMYYDGAGVPKDAAKAAEWWQKAATQGNALAQNRLGSMYLNGEGVPKDIAKAAEWWQKAATQGHATAQAVLGKMYAYGEGVPKDATKAMEWFKKAATQGDAEAQGMLGPMYPSCDGVP